MDANGKIILKDKLDPVQLSAAKETLTKIPSVMTGHSIRLADISNLPLPSVSQVAALEKDKIYFLTITIPTSQMTAKNLEIYRDNLTLWANQIFTDYGISIIPFINDERVKVSIGLSTENNNKEIKND